MVIQFDGEYYAPVLPTDAHLNHLKQDAPKYLHPMMASDFESICYHMRRNTPAFRHGDKRRSLK